MFMQDIGYVLLESYLRILESLVYMVLFCIEDVLYVDFFV